MHPLIQPEFTLYEFDDEGMSTGPSQRWLLHWDGLIGAPAQAVVFGWEAGEKRVLVRSEGERWLDDATARFTAAHLALGGTDLGVDGAPVDTIAIKSAMERIRDDEAGWHDLTGSEGQSGGSAYSSPEMTLAYRRKGPVTVFVAATGDDLRLTRTRELREWPAVKPDRAR